MIEWLALADTQKREVLNLASRQTGLPIFAIEKD